MKLGINIEHDKEYYVGIDPSLTATGLIMLNENGEIAVEKLIKTYTEHYICPEQRLLDIMDNIIFLNTVYKLKYVYVEALSYMSQSTTLFERCGLLYLITTFLFSNDIPFKLIPPKSLKKWAVNNGNASKEIMMIDSGIRWSIKFEDDNICDAYNLAQMSRYREGNYE